MENKKKLGLHQIRSQFDESTNFESDEEDRDVITLTVWNKKPVSTEIKKLNNEKLIKSESKFKPRQSSSRISRGDLSKVYCSNFKSNNRSESA